MGPEDEMLGDLGALKPVGLGPLANGTVERIEAHGNLIARRLTEALDLPEDVRFEHEEDE